MISTSPERLRDDASLFVSDQPLQIRRALRICMVAYAFYESDTRILQYATALANRGDSVDVIALRKDESFPEVEVIDGVTVYRIQSRKVNEKGLLAYCARIFRFLLRSAAVLHRRHRNRSYDVVHVHNVPDFLVLAAAPLRWRRVPIILDIHDLFPELYASKFRIDHSSRLFRFLVFLERRCAGFATHIIIANDLWRDRLAARSSTSEKCSVVRNRPDLDIFKSSLDKDKSAERKFIMIYPGSLNWHQGLDLAISAFASVVDRMPNTEFHIYGEGPARASLKQLVHDLRFSDVIIFHDFLPSREIARIMATADLAIEPKRVNSAFGNEALSTKILEFMCLGVPVIACRTRIHSYYYDDSIIQYYENDDISQLAQHMLELRNDSDLRSKLARNACLYASNHTWNVKKHEYLQLVDSLVASYATNTSISKK